MHVFFVNVNSKFLDRKGCRIGFRPSGDPHLIELGYEIRASSVAPTLRAWFK